MARRRAGAACALTISTAIPPPPLTATKLAAATIEHFTRQLEAVDRATAETIDQDPELRDRRDLLLSVIGVGETLAARLLASGPP